MSLSHSRITQLPTALQSHILSSLAPLTRCNTKPSLDTVRTRLEKLPGDLLSVAQSSRALAEATADVLGSRAQILNKGCAHPLSEWIAALGVFVKAVSLFDFDFEVLVWNGRVPKTQDFFDELFHDALDTFKALAATDIALHVLDVTILPFPRCSNPQVLTEALLKALERSSQSLQELGLRLTPICVNVVSRATLPNLNIAELTLKDIERENDDKSKAREHNKNAFIHMFRALEGHADRKANKTTLSELRLIDVVHAPCVDANDACTGLFQAIRTLKVRVTPESLHDGGTSITKFFTLFPNLRSLHWNGIPTADHLHMIHSACPKLEELSLCPKETSWSLPIPSPYAQRGDALQLNELFVACQGKLRSLEVDFRLTLDQMKVLGENSPELQVLKMEIDHENISGLPSLLGSHCQQLTALDLSFPPDPEQGPSEHGWREFAEAIRRASDTLCEISIMSDDDRDPIGYAHEAMLQSFLDIFEVLGERARKLRFEVPMVSMNLRVLFEGYCKIIDACVTHSKKLEQLTVALQPGDLDVWFDTLEEQKIWCKKLLCDWEKLRELPQLNFLSIDEMDMYADGLLGEACELLGEAYVR